MAPVLVALAASGLSAPAAAAEISPELRCQETLAKSARGYVTTVHRVRAKCENLTLAGKTCDAGQDAAKISAALAKLEQGLALRCDDSHLAALGFPGQCSDPDGPPFTVADLAACFRDMHDARIDAMIAIE